MYLCSSSIKYQWIIRNALHMDEHHSSELIWKVFIAQVIVNGSFPKGNRKSTQIATDSYSQGSSTSVIDTLQKKNKQSSRYEQSSVYDL